MDRKIRQQSRIVEFLEEGLFHGFRPFGGQQDRGRVETLAGQVGSQEPIDEALLGLALDQDVDPPHPAGLPPRTFFSHSSPRA